MKKVIIASGGEVGSSKDLLIIVAFGILIIIIIQGISYLKKWRNRKNNDIEIDE